MRYCSIVTSGRRLRSLPGSTSSVMTRRESIGGHWCFRAVEDLPQVPDAAFVAVPREAAIDTVVWLAAMGAGGAVCHTAGFAETGPEGAKLGG